MVLGVRPVCRAAAVCISSVLPTRGTLQYVGIKNLDESNNEEYISKNKGVVEEVEVHKDYGDKNEEGKT